MNGRNDRRLPLGSASPQGGGCLGIVALLIGVGIVVSVISDARNDARIDRQLAEERAAKAEFEHRYAEELDRLDNIFERVFQRCTPQEREHIDLARSYFHTKEESCLGDRGDDRKSAFEELEQGIGQISRVAELLEANPQLGPFEAAKYITPFYLWSPEDKPQEPAKSEPPKPPEPRRIVDLTLNAKAGNAAEINGRVLGEGESATIPAEPQRVRVKCLKVNKEGVLVLVEGEDEPRMLRMKIDWTRRQPDGDAP